MISRSSVGGNEDFDIVALRLENFLEYGVIGLVMSARRRFAEDLESTEMDCMCEKDASTIVDC